MLAKLQGLKPFLLIIFALIINAPTFSQNGYGSLDNTSAVRATRSQQIKSLCKQVTTFVKVFIIQIFIPTQIHLFLKPNFIQCNYQNEFI